MKQRVTAPNKKKSARKKSSKAPSRKSVKRRKPAPPEPQEFPISHAMLRAMYDAMVESRLWAQSRNMTPVISEATAVAAAAVLRSGDSLAAPPDGRTLYPITDRRAKIMPLDASKLRLACEKARRA